MFVWRLTRLAPRPVRRLMLRAVPARWRLRVVRRAMAAGPAVVDALRRLVSYAHRVVLPPVAGLRRRRIGPWSWPGVGRRAAVRVDGAASPAAVRQGNLDRVVAALDAAGIPFFRVPHEIPGRTALAVPAAHRPRVVALAARELSPAGARVQAVRSRGAERSDPRTLRICWPVTDPHHHLVLGAGYGCDVEFWREDAEMFRPPGIRPALAGVPVDDPEVDVVERTFGRFCRPASATRYRTRACFARESVDDVDFPIDAVYTWVDGSDPAWRARQTRALADNPWATVNPEAANSSRFTSRDELRYSLRSLYCYAPWIHHIFLVTDDQVPEWLDTGDTGITVVSHREIFGDTGTLPTFNSMAIESRLHRVPGLAEHFLYLNDDVFFGRPVTPSTFFTPAGATRFFLSTYRVEGGPPQPDEPPVMTAAKNNRTLIQREFGRTLAHKTKHTPHAARRSVLEEIEQCCPDEVLGTAAHQFRHPSDISLLSSLQHYWAYLTGRAVVGEIEYMYANLADSMTPIKLAVALRRRGSDVFCLNDTDSSDVPPTEQEALLGAFLPRYFPFRAPWELPDGTRRAIPTHRDPHRARLSTEAPLGQGIDHPAVL